MRQLLVINPNTSESVSALLQQHVQAAAGAQVQVQTVTARFGAPYIADEAGYAVAAHAALDAWAAALARPGAAPDAVLIGCFGDPGLMALRESSPVPVTGLAEAAFIEASRQHLAPEVTRCRRPHRQGHAVVGDLQRAIGGEEDPEAGHDLCPRKRPQAHD